MTLGERIRSARINSGLTQKQVADACGMADSAIRKYESGKITPKLETLRRISTAINADIVYLISGQTTEEVQQGIITDADAEVRTIFENLQAKSKGKVFDEQVALRNRIVHILELLDGLNATGQKKAIERLEELVEVPSYRRQDTPDSDAPATTETPKEET